MTPRDRAAMRWPAAVLLAVGVCSCSHAVGFPICQTPPPPEDVEAAKGAHAAAVRFYEKDDFDRAIELWQAAYELDCTAHRLLINVARAYEKKGDEGAALEIYRLYVERAGNAAEPEIMAKVRVADGYPTVPPSAVPLSASSAPPGTAPTKPAASSR